MTVAWSYTTTGFTFVGKSAEEIRDICLAAGLSGIEAAPPLLDRLTDTEVEAYRRTFEDAGLKLTTFHLPFTAADDIASFYNTPFLQKILFYPNDEGVGTIDVSISAEPTELASLPGIRGAYVIAVEEFPLDAMRSPTGDMLKDVSHPESRWMYLSEIERVLSVPAEELGYEEAGIDEGPGMTARLHFARVDKDKNGWIDGTTSSMVCWISS